MPRLSDLPVGESVTMLIYGPAGSGKTEFCGTAGDRTLIINTGLGIVTLQSKGFRTRHKSNPFIETVTEDPIPNAAYGFDKVCDIIDDYLKNHKDEFDTIIIDDVTALRRFAMNKGLEINQKLNRSKTATTRSQLEVIVPGIQDFSIEMNLIEQFIITYVSIAKENNKHFILTAHERVNYNKPASLGEPPTVNSIRPAFTGQTFPDSVTGHFDCVWHFETMGAGERIMYNARTAGDSALVAKTRWSGVFPVIVKNPNFLEVVAKIRESK